MDTVRKGGDGHDLGPSRCRGVEKKTVVKGQRRPVLSKVDRVAGYDRAGASDSGVEPTEDMPEVPGQCARHVDVPLRAPRARTRGAAPFDQSEDRELGLADGEVTPEPRELLPGRQAFDVDIGPEPRRVELDPSPVERARTEARLMIET